MSKIEIFEVGPRDGLQNQARVLSLQDREEFVLRLAKTGLRDIEVGSFVREDRIPQLTQTADLLKRLDSHRKSLASTSPRFWAFVPNKRGLEMALDTSVDGFGFFVAASDTFCSKNVNRTQKELLQELEGLVPSARKAKRAMRVYLSTISYCPYEGVIRPQQVQRLVKSLVDIGVKEIALGDTTGHSSPSDIEELLSLLLKDFSPNLFAMHLHDTRALALANSLIAVGMGVRRFDSSAGGLGGCPYAPGAAGNLATEDLLYMFQSMGLLSATGKDAISLEGVAETSIWLESKIGSPLPSKVLKTFQ